MRIRWSQRCAGGCRRWLAVGTQAVRAHRGYWCPACWATHRAVCQRHRVACCTAPPPEPALF